MSPNPDTIARLLNKAGTHLKTAIFAPSVAEEGPARAIDSAMQCIHQAFQEAIGGAAYAREPEPSPQPAAPAADDDGLHADDCEAGAFVELGDGPPPRCTCHVSDGLKPAAPAAKVAGRVEYTSPIGSGVLEERAEAPAPTPAPREPDGWVVVNEYGFAGAAWLRTEVDDCARCAREHVASIGPGYGYTARPFYLDTPPGPGVAWEAQRAGEEAATLRAEVERLTRERDIALSLARQCRDVALRERERIAAQFVDGSQTARVIRAISAPTLPEVP